MKINYSTYTIHELGSRDNQEDSMSIDQSHNLFILCDGMGGHEAGEVASKTVCEAMTKSIAESNDFHKAIEDAFSALDAKDNSDSAKKMGTTMTYLQLSKNSAFIAHMGDSRVYHIRPGKTTKETKILFQTQDHSLVNDLVRAGELTPEEAKNHPRKNVITRALQPHMDYRPKADIFQTQDIEPGDFFYLCTDGMLENMDNEQLAFFFSAEVDNDEKRVELLKRATRENHDNHSAIIVHILGVDGKNSSTTSKSTVWTASKSFYRRYPILIIPTVVILLLITAFILFKPEPEEQEEIDDVATDTVAVNDTIVDAINDTIDVQPNDTIN